MTSSDATVRQTLRIIDASINRTGEGLRLLEDVARLWLGDAGLTARLKAMRHALVQQDPSLQQQLIKSRDAAGDVGIDTKAPGEAPERQLPDTVIANARRAQEALRTLEEMARLTGFASRMDSGGFKHARFDLYSIEQELLGKLSRRDKAARVRGLYVILDTALLLGRDPVDMTRQALAGGARVVQLRDKMMGKRELLALARELQAICRESGVLFIMNDYLDLALAAEADGLHLGQQDLPCAEARKLLPVDVLLGCSVTSVDLARAVEDAGADYIAVGSMYETPSKETAVLIGPEMLRQVRQAVSRPLVAIGGITEDNVGPVVEAGADSVAVISAVLKAHDPAAAARRLIQRMEASSGQVD